MSCFRGQFSDKTHVKFCCLSTVWFKACRPYHDILVLSIRHGYEATSQEAEAEAEALATLEDKATVTATQRLTEAEAKAEATAYLQITGPSLSFEK